MYKYILQDKLFELFYLFIDQKWKRKLKIDKEKNNFKNNKYLYSNEHLFW